MKKFYLLMMFALLGMVVNAQTFQKVTDVAQLADGDKVVIVYENGADSKVMGASTETYRTDVGVSISSEQFVAPEGTTILTLGKNSDGTFTFNDGTGYLEYHGASNELYTQASGDINWTVTNESIVNSNVIERYLQYNPSAKRFACYKLSSNQKNVCLYKETITTKVSAPEFSIAEGTYYNPLTIDLSCVTTDAFVFYTINDGAETRYEAPIELSESGEYTIKAWATKAGLENSEMVSKTYTLKIGEQPMNFELNIGNYCTNAGIDNGDVVYEIIYNNVIFAATDGGSNSPKYYTSNQTWRIYTNGSLTITAPEGYFVETVNFEFGKKNITSVDNGTWDNSSSAWTASDNTQSVKFNIGGTTEIKSITVVLKEADSNQVLAPTFSVEAGDIYPDTEIAINCATEGATIKYILDGEAKEYVYSEPLTFETGTTVTITAWAEAEGLKASEKVVATYNVVEKPEGTDFVKVTDLSQLKDGDRVIIACESQNTILAAPDSDVRGYVEFGLSESFTLPGTSGASILTLGIENGQYTFFDGTYYLALTSDGNKLHSVDMIGNDAYWTIEINAGETTITSVSYSARSMKYNASDPRFACYETGQESVSIYREPNGSSSVNDAVANEFKAVAVANGIEVNVAEAGLVSVYNAAGQLVANVNVAEGATTINVAGGFYIVKAGNNVAKVLVK